MALLNSAAGHEGGQRNGLPEPVEIVGARGPQHISVVLKNVIPAGEDGIVKCASFHRDTSRRARSLSNRVAGHIDVLQQIWLPIWSITSTGEDSRDAIQAVADDIR